MNIFYLTPTATSDLALLIFTGFITAYLIQLTWRLRKKRPFQTLTLALAFTFTSGYILLDFLNEILYPDLAYWFLPLQSISMTIGMVWLLQFAYRMPTLYPERRRESYIALGVTILLPLWEISYAAHRYADLREGIVTYRPSNADYVLAAVFFWMVIVYLRQMGRADTRSIALWRKFWHPEGRTARAARRFALVSLLPVGLTAVLLLQSKLNLPTTIASILLSIGLLFTILLFALVYLDYLPEQTTFMVRLTAVTLAFFLAVLGAVGQAMTPSFVASYDNHDLINTRQTVRFTPNAQDGYDITQIPYAFDTQPAAVTQDNNEWGERLLYNEEQHLLLDFEFPFYNQLWSELFVRWSGGILFGRASSLHDSLFRYESMPTIYMMGANLEGGDLADPDQGIFVDSSPEQLTITWLNMPEKDIDQNQYTYQLRLYPDGVFEMTFVSLPTSMLYDINSRWQTARVIGVLSGGLCDTFVNCLTPYPDEYIQFNNDLPYSSGEDGAVEDYHRDFRIALHNFLLPLFWLTLFSALFVPVGLSLVLKQNVTRPLRSLLTGVKQINDGDLDIYIPIQAEDEFGYLTHAFNRMAAELNVQVADLEGRVAERTAQLTESATYLDNILRNATDYAIVTVDRDLNVTYINPMAEALYDVSAAAVLAQPIALISKREIDPERFKAGLRSVQAGNAHQYVRAEETTDAVRHIAARLSGIFNEEGVLIGYAHFSQDISERVQTDAQLLTQQRTLSALEERERIGRELHDSIGQVMGYLNLQLQASRALLVDDRQDAVDELLAQLITVTQQSHNDVREFILGMKKPANAATDFWTALHLLAETFEEQRHISMLLSIPPDKPAWFVSPNNLHLLRLIQEALTNVYKHAAATQVQIIATRITPTEAQFIISDNGCGFNEKLARDKEHAPEPHFGMNIMRERATELNGRLEVRSTIGQGTQIVVTAEIQPETAVDHTAQHPIASLRVLLVDDHPLFREGLANLLEVYGVTVVGTAGNGLQAQEMARKTRPDLIVMDIEMPVCNGIEATRRIKGEFPDQRIIMLTTSATDDTLFAALKAGASGYLLKSMGTEELFMLIAGLGDGVPPIAPELAGKVMEEFQRLTRPESKLNERQDHILQLVANGRSYREIAVELHLSERTVKRQMKQIMDALHLDSRAETEEYARRRA